MMIIWTRSPQHDRTHLHQTFYQKTIWWPQTFLAPRRLAPVLWIVFRFDHSHGSVPGVTVTKTWPFFPFFGLRLITVIFVHSNLRTSCELYVWWVLYGFINCNSNSNCDIWKWQLIGSVRNDATDSAPPLITINVALAVASRQAKPTVYMNQLTNIISQAQTHITRRSSLSSFLRL